MNWQCRLTLSCGARESSLVEWSPTCTQVAISSDSTIEIWDTTTGTCSMSLRGDKNFFYALAWSPDGTQLAASHENRIKIWNLDSNREAGVTLEGHNVAITSLAWSLGGAQIGSASFNGWLAIWDLGTGQCKVILVNSRVDDLRFEPPRYLHTSVGRYDLEPTTTSPNSDFQPYLPQPIGFGIDRSNTWVTFCGQNVLWLPPDYRPTVSTVLGTTVVIGCASGRVLMLKFSESISTL
jgi:WD40 repeat protein